MFAYIIAHRQVVTTNLLQPGALIGIEEQKCGVHEMVKFVIFRTNFATLNIVNSREDLQIWLAPAWSFRTWAAALQLYLSPL